MKTVRKENTAAPKQRADTIDLLEVLQILLKNLHIILFSTFLFGFLALAATFFLITPQYQAQITLYMNNMSSSQGTSTISQSDISASVQLVNTYSAILKSETLLEEVIEQAGVDMTPEELQKKIEVSSVNSSEVFQVTVTDADPKAAARIDNAIADIAPDQIAQIVDGSSVKVINRAKIPEKICSPSYGRNTEMGLLLGFVLSAGLLIFLGMMDSSIQVQSDLTKWGFPVLGIVPDLGDTGAKSKNGYGYDYNYGYQKQTEEAKG